MAGERESSARRSATSSVVVVVLELASMIFAGLSGVMEFWARRSSSTSGVVDVWVSALTSMVLAGERESSARGSATSSVVVVVLELASMIFAGLSGVMEFWARRSSSTSGVVDVWVSALTSMVFGR